MTKYIWIFLGCLSFFVVNVLHAETKVVTLRAGTPVLLALKQNITGKEATLEI